VFFSKNLNKAQDENVGAVLFSRFGVSPSELLTSTGGGVFRHPTPVTFSRKQPFWNQAVNVPSFSSLTPAFLCKAPLESRPLVHLEISRLESAGPSVFKSVIAIS